ncbi:hypothetical protein [Pseudomonas sp. RIT-PI-AD]|uniref:hypothetical protein n=1 Tax=Pseudomonas sp. RIT-PI-AD TaxID=3035294 RepID=UPI0021D95625|nr:hypothetical protein [Pseudomonas sp. RIT-PI-AD]
MRETNSHARRLYEKFGFVEEGCLQKRILLPDNPFIADITMAWFALNLRKLPYHPIHQF